MSKQTRLKPDVRKEQLLTVAVDLAAELGYTQLTRDSVADAAGVTSTAIQYHFKTMQRFRREVMRYAVRCRNAIVVAQGLALKDPHALKADDALKHEARRALF